MTTQAAVQIANDGARGDRLGVICSAACAVHCAAMPLLLAMLPSLSLAGWLNDPLFHQIVAAACVLLVYRAIVPAWEVHRNRMVAAAAAGGVALVCLSSFVLPGCCSGEMCAQAPGLAEESTFAIAGLPQFHSRPLLQHDDLYRLFGDDLSFRLLGVQPYLNPLGGCLLIIAHVLNARLRRRRSCRRC